MKRIAVLFSVLLLTVICMAQSEPRQRQQRVRTVVIDPGHGGHDPGAVGRIYKEKDIALSIGLKLGGYIEGYLPDVNVVYTRTTDVFVPLHRRAQIANENKADVFISIHCNAARNRQAYGAETFVMGIHRSQENLEVAIKENAVILLEDDYDEIYDGFDPNSPESNIIFSLYQNVYLDQSLLIAKKVQDQFRERVGRNDRGVKQAGFWVLYKVAATGILVEAGFLSNEEEEKFLGSEAGQTYIASAIFRAFRDYKYKIEGESYDAPVIQPDIVAETIVEDIKENDETETLENYISFRVQFSASSTRKPTNDPEFSALDNVKIYYLNGLYRYTTGDFNSLEDAAKWQVKVQSKGFNDAFVVAFHNDKRISREEALRLIKNN